MELEEELREGDWRELANHSKCDGSRCRVKALPGPDTTFPAPKSASNRLWVG